MKKALVFLPLPIGLAVVLFSCGGNVEAPLEGPAAPTMSTPSDAGAGKIAYVGSNSYIWLTNPDASGATNAADCLRCQGRSLNV